MSSATTNQISTKQPAAASVASVDSPAATKSSNNSTIQMNIPNNNNNNNGNGNSKSNLNISSSSNDNNGSLSNKVSKNFLQ